MSSWPSVVILQPGPGSPPRNHTGRTAFPNARARDSAGFPPELLGTSQTLSFRRSQWDLQKKSSSGVVTLCSAFVGVQNETRRVEATTACLTQWPKIITLPHLGPSPQAVPLGSAGSPLPDCVTEGLPRRPKETYWHSVLVSCHFRGHICTSIIMQDIKCCWIPFGVCQSRRKWNLLAFALSKKLFLEISLRFPDSDVCSLKLDI